MDMDINNEVHTREDAEEIARAQRTKRKRETRVKKAMMSVPASCGESPGSARKGERGES
jgi:hypothetical protein